MRLVLGQYADAVGRRTEALVAGRVASRIWDRDAALWGDDAARLTSVGNRLGWLEVASAMQARVSELQAFADGVRDDGFKDVVLLGMGGSSLAPEVLRQSVERDESYPRLHVLDTTDPATIRSVMDNVDVGRTLFFVSSKSGGTIEVASLFAYMYERVTGVKHDRAGENFVAITDEGTALQKLAGEHSFRHVFTNPGDIGGRYSALSYFGLAPAAASGIDVGTLLERAVQAQADAQSPDSDALRLGVAMGEMALAGRDKLTFIVTDEVRSFGLWAEQLIAESTGKLGLGILPVVGEPLGTPLKYGDDRLFVQLRLEAGSTGGDDAVVGALTAEGQPVIVIDLEDAYDIGREFFRWEFATAIAGRVLGINPFDEPNVQESKDNTARVLRSFEQSGTLDAPGIDDGQGLIAITATGVAEVAAAIPALLAEMGDGDYFAITAYIESDARAEATFGDIRRIVRGATGAATTLGYGPRFLHSTGQLHKGGPARGVFLQVTAPDENDIAIPGRPYTFGQLKRAQAIGDFDSLVSHGRPVLRVHLGVDNADGLADLREAVRRALAPMNAELRK